MHSLELVIRSKRVDINFHTKKKLSKRIMAKKMRDTKVMRSLKVKIMVFIKRVARDMSKGQVTSIRGAEITLIRGVRIALIEGEEVNRGVVREIRDLDRGGWRGLEVGLRTGQVHDLEVDPLVKRVPGSIVAAEVDL